MQKLDPTTWHSPDMTATQMSPQARDGGSIPIESIPEIPHSSHSGLGELKKTLTTKQTPP